MGPLAVVLVVFPLVVIALMVASTWAMNVAAERLVGEKHRTIEAIIATGEVPGRWRRTRARPQAGEQAADRCVPAGLQQRVKERYLQRLDGLIRYAERATLVADDETRAVLLEGLRAVRARWEAQDPGQL